MRRICIVVLYLLLSVVSNAQPVQDRGTTAVTVRDWRWMGGYNAFMPRYIDTTEANLQKGIDSSGALIYCYNTKSYWYRQNSPKKWVNLGNGTSPIDTSKYVKYTDSTIKYVTPTQLSTSYNLQKVTDNGNTTNNFIWLTKNPDSSFIVNYYKNIGFGVNNYNYPLLRINPYGIYPYSNNSNANFSIFHNNSNTDAIIFATTPYTVKASLNLIPSYTVASINAYSDNPIRDNFNGELQLDFLRSGLGNDGHFKLRLDSLANDSTITLQVPKNNGNKVIPISINGLYANSRGDISLSIPLIDSSIYATHYYVDSSIASNVPALTLQDVTDNGNTTTQDVTVNNLSSKSVIVTGTNGNGHIHLRHQSSDATGTGQSTTLFANSNGYLKWKNDGNYYSTLAMPQTADRTYKFQNKSYTLADSTTLADSVSALRTTLNSKGTVTSIATSTSTGITGGTITTSGTLSIDTTLISTRAWRQKAVDSLNTIIATKGSGTVTSIATGLGLSGGTITTSGTITVDTSNASILSRQRAATTYQPTLSGTGLAYSTGGTISYKTQIDSPWRAWTEPLTWTATTAPSGTANNYYRWSQNGKLVHLEIRLNYANTGIAITQIRTNLPAEMPLPSIATNWGTGTIGDILFYAIGNFSTTFTGLGNNLFCSIIFGDGSSSRGNKIQMNMNSTIASKYIYKIDYLID